MTGTFPTSVQAHAETARQASALLAELMARDGITGQRELVRHAKAQGHTLALGTVSNLLAGKHVPDTDNARKLAALFGVKPSDFRPDLADFGEPGSPGTPGIGRAPLETFVPSPMNERKTYDRLAIMELAETIAEQGLLQPLLVYRQADGCLEVDEGGRRLRALRYLKDLGRLPGDLARDGIPYYEGRPFDDADRKAASITANLQREDTNPVDRAAAYGFLRDQCGWTPADMARRMGRTTNHFMQYLQIHDRLPDDAKQRLRDGDITFREARDMVQAHKPAPAETPLPLPQPAPPRAPRHQPTADDYQAALAAPRSDEVPVGIRVIELLAEVTGTPIGQISRSTALVEDLDIEPHLSTLQSDLSGRFQIDMSAYDWERIGTVAELTRLIIGRMGSTTTPSPLAGEGRGEGDKAEVHSGIKAGPGTVITEDTAAVGRLLGDRHLPWTITRCQRRLDGTITHIHLSQMASGRQVVFVPEQRDLED